jgi:hypothetical protein
MEKLDNNSETSLFLAKKNEEEKILSRVRQELGARKNENLAKKEQDEDYVFDIAELELETVGIREAQLWEIIESIASREDYEAAKTVYNEYRQQVNKDFEQYLEGKQLSSGSIENPKGNISSVLGNRLNGKMLLF